MRITVKFKTLALHVLLAAASNISTAQSSECAATVTTRDDGGPYSFSCALEESLEDCINDCFPDYVCSDANPCTAEGQWCTFALNNSGVCAHCDEVSTGSSSPGFCNYYELPLAGQEACKSTCFTTCTSNDDCGEGSFCTLEKNGGASGYCADCAAIADNLGPQGCTEGTKLFDWTPAGEEACLSKCFNTCTDSTNDCSYDSIFQDKGYCSKINGPDAEGYCAPCYLAGEDPFQSDPRVGGCFINPLDPSLPAISGEECASVCLGSCTLAEGCPDDYETFCASGPDAVAGYCMQCSSIYFVDNCFERETTQEGKVHCASTCFGTCSADNPCPEKKFCDFRNGDDGYCNRCSPTGNPYSASSCGLFDPNPKGQESCIKSCFDFCSDSVSCPDIHEESGTELFCDYQLNATAGACHNCPYTKTPEVCVNGGYDNLTLFPPYTQAGQESCQSKCLRPCQENTAKVDCGSDDIEHVCIEGYCHLGSLETETPTTTTPETSASSMAVSKVPFLIIALASTVCIMFSLALI